ncbi:MAG: hypothetical protein M3N82_15710, partial [Pseudomonadota bacterium]|nr:hypothetical protein [Pseudomonadota bacterium]
IGKDDGPTVTSDRATRDQGTADSANSGPRPTPSQDPPANEADRYAIEYIERLRTGIAEPGELSALLAYLVEESVHQACRRIERTLGVKHA